MTEALQIISNEHRSMWQLTVVLDELRKQLGNPRQKPDSDLFNLILDYIEQYIERVHEPKEEAFLYKAVMERTSEGNEMIAEFQREHASTPEVVARLRSQLKSLVRDYPAGVAEFQAALEEYISMMRRHILRRKAICSRWRARYSPMWTGTKSTPRLPTAKIRCSAKGSVPSFAP
ncbi:MAG: hemerythrin domain-containing protein [Sulfuritalea sp.]|nr:hemerythrin domain-containing protein [Sulfuritalea sp.]